MPLRQLARDANRIKELCDLLEFMADDLPRRSPAVWREARLLSTKVLARHFRALSECLLPILAREAEGDFFAAATVARIWHECENCKACLAELSDLLEYSHDCHSANMSSETVGYALRGFFSDIRRQIAWEESVLLPLASQRCDDLDIYTLRDCLLSTPKPINGEAEVLFAAQRYVV
ncbi:MAG: hemerythrin domain-containing protein [Pseudomonadota bacterium]